jgi:hypothetical protein
MSTRASASRGGERKLSKIEGEWEIVIFSEKRSSRIDPIRANYRNIAERLLEVPAG